MAIVLADCPYDFPSHPSRARKGVSRYEKRQLEDEAIDILRRIMRGRKYADSSRVGAARTILEYATSDPVAEAFAMLHGSDEQALAWLKSKTEALEAKLAERNGGANSSDEREHQRTR